MCFLHRPKRPAQIRERSSVKNSGVLIYVSLLFPFPLDFLLQLHRTLHKIYHHSEITQLYDRGLENERPILFHCSLSGRKRGQPIFRYCQNLESIQSPNSLIPCTVGQKHPIFHECNRRIAIPTVRTSLNNSGTAPGFTFIFADGQAQWCSTARGVAMDPGMVIPDTEQLTCPGNVLDGSGA